MEYEGRLADLASTNLANLPNVTVVEGDAALWPRGGADCVYVNFSIERPASAWIDHLNSGGRLIFPLGVPHPNGKRIGGRHSQHGAGFRIERHGGTLFSATWLGQAAFICGEGQVVGSDVEREALRGAFERGGVEFVQSLRWRQPPSPTRSWFTGSDWSLSYDEIT